MISTWTSTIVVEWPKDDVDLILKSRLKHECERLGGSGVIWIVTRRANRGVR